MKPAPFSYVRPSSLDEACAALASEEDARVLAGGQTLMPMLAMRLSRPTLLVDITRIAELIGIEEQGSSIVVRAATVQAYALRSELIAREVPLLAKALPNVGHPPTRNRGTVGGSVAHGDPSAEISLAATVLEAGIVFRDGEDETSFLPEEFFIGPTVTMAPMGGCLTRIVFPKKPSGRVGTGFHEVASRRSDYAFASAAAQLVFDEDGTCSEARLGIGSVGDVPVKVDVDGLVGGAADDAAIRDVVAEALRDLEAVDDLHATASYRRRAAAALAERALREARDEALESRP
ncbi:FAD binding domain-containing protein [Lutibaculum baratangense]|uniref:Carbon monoxide dehydrogenase medium chain n=1 Tax=Lutibaculum baratangense AMV1 TaxID=631454 RepID=V4R4G3_9HYPH|nr:FAD binding domain-containing protein [Lutibaculum baratangense]ESR26847.1 Carbon monoxide dehydrogenase medium chain [Lutibaculum baratangense AMV1]